MKIPIIGRFFEKRSSLSNPAAWLIDLLGGGNKSKAGIRVTESDALRVSAVFACVNLISQTLASLPLFLYKHVDRGKVKAKRHKLYELLHSLPNKETTSFDFWFMYLVNLLLTGDAFAFKKRDGNGKIIELWNIPTGNVTIFRNKITNELYYKVKDDEGNEGLYYPEDIMHTRGMRFQSKDASLHPISLARDALGLSMALEEYASNYFKNGANPGGIVEVAGQLNEDAFERFKESFLKKYSGIGTSSKVLFLESGSKYIKLGNNPEESQSLESRKFQVVEIARYFNVPPHKIMDLERSTNNNIEHQGIEFVQGCISPYAVRIEQTIYKDLLSQNERLKFFAKFALNGLLRGDTNARKDWYSTMLQNGVFSPNTVLELEDMNTYDGGDIRMVNGNMIPVNQLEKFIEHKLKGGEANGKGNANNSS